MQPMNSLSRVLIFKILATLVFWCLPLIAMPSAVLETFGFPEQQTYMFIRMLGWAYLALCVGYCFALRAALDGHRLMGPIWVGLVSNAGGCVYLLYYGVAGTWSEWGVTIQFIGWSSVVATALITLGLLMFGVRGTDPVVTWQRQVKEAPCN